MKRGGKGRPLGRRVLGSRSSLKNGWTQASNCKRYITVDHWIDNDNTVAENWLFHGNDHLCCFLFPWAVNVVISLATGNKYISLYIAFKQVNDVDIGS